MPTNTKGGFPIAIVAASGRSPEIPESADVYGWLVGSWELDVRHYRGVDLSAQRMKGEVHASWTLEGRAVQDVWIMPPRDPSGQRPPNLDKINNMYGTTLRVWDPTIEAWRITWINPAHNHREEQIGRRVGNEIIQLGQRSNGTPTRWRFTEITPSSFHWLGDALASDGKTWNLEGEFLAR